MKLIGLVGKAGSGKSTAAEALVDYAGVNEIALADPMKKFVAKLFGWHTHLLWGPSHLRSERDARWDGLTPRKALQELGTGWGRSMHPDVWIRYALKRIEKMDAPCVITDCRFRNEADAIRKAGGEVWRVVRPVLRPIDTHASETEQDLIEVDDVLFNAGTEEEFRANVVKLAKSRGFIQ